METEGSRNQGNERNAGWKSAKIVHRHQIKEYLERWVIQYQRKISDEDLAALLEIYSEDLKQMKWTRQRFESAAIKVTQVCRFFPSVADLVEVDQKSQVANARTDERQNKSFRYSRTEAETEHGRRQMKNIWDILEGRITKEEGVRRSYAILAEFKKTNTEKVPF